MKRKKGADVNQEHEYGISSFLSAPSSFQENEISQKIAFRLVHKVKQRRQFAISILEIYVTEPIFSDLLKDIYPDSDLFLFKMDASNSWNTKTIVQIISHHRDAVPDKFDIIIIAPNCQFGQEVTLLLEWVEALLEKKGLVATTFFGPDTFLEMKACLNWIDHAESEYSVTCFPSKNSWEKRWEQHGLYLDDVQEDQFRKTYHNSRAIFQMAAMLGYFQAMEEQLLNNNNNMLHSWMKAYEQGFRTKDGNVYTTYHLIDLIGHFL
jgi:malonyl-CoA O-methyltransferase